MREVKMLFQSQDTSSRRFCHMSEDSPKNSADGVRRFLSDLRESPERRSWQDRREHDRRSGEQDVQKERRVSNDRRSDDRRVMLLDRRRGNPETFIKEHAEWIRQAILDADREASCPRCEGDLMLGPAVMRGESLARQVHCTACRHCIVISGLPGESGSG